MNPIKPPNKEQMLFSQLQVAEGITQYVFDNLEGTIYEDDDDAEEHLFDAMSSLSKAVIQLHYLMSQSCARKSACY